MILEEYLLAYKAFSTEPGVCHVVLGRDAPEGSAVVVGDPEDNPGTSVTNAIERVASAIDHHLFHDKFDFRLYQYEPRGLPDLKPTFYVVIWRGGRPGSMPTWEPVLPEQDAFLAEASHHFEIPDYNLENLAGRQVIDATDPADVVTRLKSARPPI